MLRDPQHILVKNGGNAPAVKQLLIIERLLFTP
jgi:hypothetical protein